MTSTGAPLYFSALPLAISRQRSSMGNVPPVTFILAAFDGAKAYRHIEPMAILKIARMGHPVLRRKADPVVDPTAPEIARLVEDMTETMRDAPGIGLAAPQVHVPLRLVIFHVPGDRVAPGEAPLDLTVLMNHVIEPLTPETALGWEGCLSVPGLRGVVPRWTQIRYSGVGLDGGPIRRE